MWDTLDLTTTCEGAWGPRGLDVLPESWESLHPSRPSGPVCTVCRVHAKARVTPKLWCNREARGSDATVQGAPLPGDFSRDAECSSASVPPEGALGLSLPPLPSLLGERLRSRWTTWRAPLALQPCHEERTRGLRD